MTRAGLVGLAMAILACGFPRETWAKDEAPKPPVRTDFARREADSPGLQDFRGGCPGPDGVTLVIALLLAPVVLPLYGLYALGEWIVSLCHPAEKPPSPAPPPKKDPAWVPTPGAAQP